MRSQAALAIAIVSCLGFVAVMVAAGQEAASSQTSDGLEETLQEILLRAEQGAEQERRFEIDEKEANRYLEKRSAEELPKGVYDPWVRFDQDVTVVGATLDLDELEEELPSSVVFQLLSGRVPVELTARLVAGGGVGKLDLEQILLGGVELPPTLLETLSQELDPSTVLPEGFRLGEAFPLPFHLESIQCRPGWLFVRQRAVTADRDRNP